MKPSPGVTLLQIQNLTRKYETADIETTALNNINLEITQGEFLAVMGPSGCGKSTLLNILGLIDRPSSGTYILQGTSVESLSENQKTRLRRQRMGFIFQNYNLINELNVIENVELPLIFQGVKRKERRLRAEQILNRLNMGHRGSHYPPKLSGGQQQRVAFARAIVSNPKLVLADEPTGNLDSSFGQIILNLLTDFNREGGTVVLVTHSPKDASFAHRVIQLRDGAIYNPANN
jgi:putative ABC transport system ATP-binding protein